MAIAISPARLARTDCPQNHAGGVRVIVLQAAYGRRAKIAVYI